MKSIWYDVAKEARERIAVGEPSDNLAHALWHDDVPYSLSSGITGEDYLSGGYIEIYKTLEQWASKG